MVYTQWLSVKLSKRRLWRRAVPVSIGSRGGKPHLLESQCQRTRVIAVVETGRTDRIGMDKPDDDAGRRGQQMRRHGASQERLVRDSKIADLGLVDQDPQALLGMEVGESEWP